MSTSEHTAGTPYSAPSRRPVRSRTTVVDGRRLRQLRRQRGLSQDDLAAKAGISLTTVARLERQPAGPCRCRTLARLARALDEDPASTVLRPPN
ncbi:MAG: helix-turn-helix domain-containing protein [Streptosporangiaceae bacterium]